MLPIKKALFTKCVEEKFSEVSGYKGMKRGPKSRASAFFCLLVTEVAAMSDARTFAQWHHAYGKR